MPGMETLRHHALLGLSLSLSYLFATFVWPGGLWRYAAMLVYMLAIYGATRAVAHRA